MASSGQVSPETLNATIRGWIARNSIGASTLRSAGAHGVNDAVRVSLKRIDLERFVDKRDQAAFATELNRVTRVLGRNVPHGGSRWGTAPDRAKLRR